MPLGTNAMWGVVLPTEKPNLASNPSFEYGTAGVDAIQPGAVGSVASFQQFGVWSCAVTLSANGTGGAAFDLWTAGNGTDYTVSFYGRVPAGVPFKIGVGNSSGLSLVGSADYTGGGTWQRYSCAYTESTGATRRPVFKKAGDATTGTAYFDGIQIEVGSLTTYIDGDQEGCLWQGAPHASSSLRSGQSRAGGSVVALADLGFRVDDAAGIGMAPLETSSQSYALLPGAEFQSQRAEVRPFILSTQMGGTTWRDFHNTRRTVINALKIDAVAEQQPIRFWYVGGEGTMQIDAVLDAGMEGGNKSGFTESYGVRFLAHDPYWKSTTDQGAALAGRTAIGSANWIVKRDSLGRWGTLGVAGTTANNQIQAMAVGTDGIIYPVGLFTSLGGTANRPYVGMYNPTTNLFGTLSGGTPNNIVKTVSVNAQGSVFFGGSFTAIGGTTAGYIGFWSGGYGTFGSMSGDANTADGVRAMTWNQYGTLFLGGDFTKANGTAAFYVALYGPGGPMGTLIGLSGASTINLNVYGMTIGGDNTLYLAGAFGSAGGTSAKNIAKWSSNAVGTLGYGADNSVYSVKRMPNGKIATAGLFTYIGSTYAPSIGLWNGVGWEGLGSGLTNNTQAFNVAVTSDGGLVAVGAFTRSGATLFPDPEAFWTGYNWLPLDIDLQNVGQINDAVVGFDQTLYIAGSFTGTAQAASVVQIVNVGAAEAYPILKARNTGSGTARLYQLKNTTTGDNLYFNLVLQVGEEVQLRFMPGNRSFQSSFRGNIFSSILLGSNLASWRLLPGTNYVSFFADSDNLTTSLYWRPRSWSADGTVV